MELLKIKKLGDPTTAVQIGVLDAELFAQTCASISDKYSLSDPKYATVERMFFDTRRIVVKTKYIKTEKQLYTDLDFDYFLIDLIDSVVENIKQFIPNAEPTLIQIATILPDQKLEWHVDTFLYQQFSNKIHIPLFSNSGAFYDVWNSETKSVSRIHMTEGVIWNINNLNLHRSINTGSTPRSHLILDFIDRDILSVLEESGVNYFHHRLPEMSLKERRQQEQLRDFWLLRNPPRESAPPLL